MNAISSTIMKFILSPRAAEEVVVLTPILESLSNVKPVFPYSLTPGFKKLGNCS